MIISLGNPRFVALNNHSCMSLSQTIFTIGKTIYSKLVLLGGELANWIQIDILEYFKLSMNPIEFSSSKISQGMKYQVC